MNRRGFLQACLASAAAPYVVTGVGVLMPSKKLLTVDRDMLIGIMPSKLYCPPEQYNNFAKILWPGIKVYWEKHYEGVVTEYVELFDKAKLNEL